MSHEQTQARRVAWRGWRLPRVRRISGWSSVARIRPHPQARPVPTALSGYVAFAALLVFPVVLKLIKAIDMTEGRLTAGDLVRVVAADLALAGASLAIALALAAGLRRIRFGAFVYPILITPCLIVLLTLCALEHQAWARSSSLLDWSIFWYTIQHYHELRAVIAAETTVMGVLLLVLAALLSLSPLLADLIAARLYGVGLEVRWRTAAIGAACALPLWWLASGKPHAPELHPLMPSAPIGLLTGAFSAATEAAAGSAHYDPPDIERARQRIDGALASANPTLAAAADRPKNVMLVVLESTRFDATTPYVPRLRTTPRLQQLADPGLVVSRALVDMPHTSKALVSILCGYSPRFSVQISEAEPGGLPRPCLAHVFGKLGYKRAFFQAATGSYEGRHQLALNAGYDEVFARESYDETGFEETNYLSVEDKVMVQPIMRWLGENKQSPFFLTVLTCITHHSYGLPSEFQVRQYPRQPALMGGRMPRPWNDYNRYLNTVEYADQFLGDLVDGLREQGLLDDTLIVVVGDHGQGFYEHGQKAHNTVIWEEALRVPLVFHNPRLFAQPRTIEGLRRQVDIAPTILAQLGVQFPPQLFEGRDLTTAPEHERAISSCWYDRRCMAETTSGQVRVVDHFDNQPMEVYDLANDPFERRNLLLASSEQERPQWRATAEAARQRMRAHQQQIEQQYARGALDDHEFVLDKEPRPTYPLRARLEDSIELIGYDTPSHEVVPDSFWESVVYFKCLKSAALGWRLFGVLESADGRQEQVDHHPANSRFFLHECKPGMVIADHVRVWVPGDFAPGPARYWWGSVMLKDLGHVSRENKRLQRRDVTPLQRGVLVKNQGVLLAKLQVKPQYRTDLSDLLAASVLKKAPAIAQPLEARFGDNLVLLQARAEPAQVRRLGSVTLTTIWRVEGREDGPWQIMVHMDSHLNGYWMRRMHTPVDGVHPIANWQPGTWIVDTRTIPVPEYMPLGQAKLWVGVRSSSRRLKLSDEGQAVVDDRRVFAGDIEVVRP